MRIDDIGLSALVREKGAVVAFAENRLDIARRMRDVDPEHWRLFKESQEMARANVDVGGGARSG